jgi:NADH:ubiquinone oxidoreductase subunit 3 (subunit A)
MTAVTIAWLSPLIVVLALAAWPLIPLIAVVVAVVARRSETNRRRRYEAAVAARRAQFGSWA